MDNSRPIVLAVSATDVEAQFVSLGPAGQQHLLANFESAQPIVGFYHDPSCWSDPWHESDLLAYYSDGSQGYQHSNLTFNGNTAQLAVQVDQPASENFVAFSCSLEAQFSVSAAQAALDQVYPHQKPKKKIDVPAAERQRVPVSWQIAGTYDGQPFEFSFVAEQVIGTSW